ncbi:hypothetical protein MUY14_11440 [Amycolatopsis sp. FBCC-B4732]|uniref:hypothetical protein n=1 Tax=Amycolatopsis sp. FBCC-B4732 TaxID=3079339 RepID=UPI001FF36B8E|nr:hypothetical protein [Amycolatopsis sp. FBCC-B4732]UOX91198.1 hypothetical protein MUY14_11440 [Amycolatopsis sp. FBCC-B4732]
MFNRFGKTAISSEGMIDPSALLPSASADIRALIDVDDRRAGTALEAPLTDGRARERSDRPGAAGLRGLGWGADPVPSDEPGDESQVRQDR